ncbi:TctA subunit of the tripartite Tricarboxylate transport(TTT) family protein [Allopusillimonas ginsengisoli]|nr:TctA subunit of the tripartite Tricarboxylate transport(TTT) family protein [Allopusillimonas ginsengisoli]
MFAVIVGSLSGLIIGVLPGLGPAAGVAIMLPIVLSLDPTTALAMLAGVYFGAMYGGAITAILLGIPGDAPAVMTVLDGHPLAKKGEAGRALGISIIASFIGGIVGLVGLTFSAQIIASYALAFGPSEITALMVFSLSLVSLLSSDAPAKGFAVLGVGIWLGTIGLDAIIGTPRFTFGTAHMLDGLDFAVVAVGLFGVGEMLFSMRERSLPVIRSTYSYSSMRPRLSDVYATKKALSLGSAIGFFIGVLPGVGATASTMVSYATAKKFSSEPEKFGHGAPEGIAAPESANNSAAYGSMVTLFTLGIPGSATTAVLLAGLVMLGLQPGPLLFQQHGELVWTLFGTFYVGNVVLLIMTAALVPLLAAAIFTPRMYLYPIVLCIIVYGVYSINYSTFDLLMVVVFGVVGYLMKTANFPLAPLVLGLILGPILEVNIRRTLVATRGDWTAFINSPISFTVYALTLLLILTPLFKSIIGLLPNKRTIIE